MYREEGWRWEEHISARLHEPPNDRYGKLLQLSDICFQACNMVHTSDKQFRERVLAINKSTTHNYYMLNKFVALERGRIDLIITTDGYPKS